ncbi:hypothetical protein CVT24_006136 [Panaeolus cyanescens]|uniref:Uncharacterized protein n=1 Tax=Panaeolus cyanescens TaxID=181874 RepID=A0A409WHK5_9AGAR|nr:hypothetical protein CVT24_006136 [Panaeolus cyanescens]
MRELRVSSSLKGHRARTSTSTNASPGAGSDKDHSNEFDDVIDDDDDDDAFNVSIFTSLEILMEKSIMHGLEIGFKAQREVDGYKGDYELESNEIKEVYRSFHGSDTDSEHEYEGFSTDEEGNEFSDIDEVFAVCEDDDEDDKEEHDFSGIEKDDEVDQRLLAAYIAPSQERFAYTMMAQVEEEPNKRDADQGLVNDEDDDSDSPLDCLFLGGIGFDLEPWSTRKERMPQALDAETTNIKLLLHLAQFADTDAPQQLARRFLKALKTPKKDRTQAQRFLWRKQEVLHDIWIRPPRKPSSNCLGSELLELVVDASNYGIGMVLHDIGWMGWKFRESDYIMFGGDGNINMCWAELTAVEVGVRTFIQNGYTNTKVYVYSDNDGVVKALECGRWGRQLLFNVVLGRIHSLCEEYGVQIIPRWISTHNNPADGISRGVYPGTDIIKLLNAKGMPPALDSPLKEILEPVYSFQD